MVETVLAPKQEKQENTGHTVTINRPEIWHPRYEICVVLDGWHLFATDSLIRDYSPARVADMIVEFQKVWPNAKIVVTAFDGQVDHIIQAALDKTVDIKRLNHEIGKFRKEVNRQRANDYVGETSEEEACAQ